MTSGDAVALPSAIDTVADVIPLRARSVKVGSLALLGSLEPFCSAVERELYRPLAGMLDTRSVCFLRPDSPLVYPVDEAHARALWDQGASIAIQHVDYRNSAVRTLCRVVSGKANRRTTASLYLSRARSTSMAEHTDAWDAWLLQVRGAKNFTLVDDETARRRSINMAAGRWLWMPTGTQHVVETHVDLSLHLSMNIHDDDS